MKPQLSGVFDLMALTNPQYTLWGDADLKGNSFSNLPATQLSVLLATVTVPEVSSIVLFGLVGLGGIGLFLARRLLRRVA